MLTGLLQLRGCVLGHPWAAALASSAQQLATCLCSDPGARAWLEAACRNKGMPMLQPADPADVSSVCQCIGSLVQLIPAMRACPQVEQQVACPTAGALAAACMGKGNSCSAQLEALHGLLEPIEAAVAAADGRGSPMAEMTRHWLRVGRAFIRHLPSIEHEGKLLHRGGAGEA